MFNRPKVNMVIYSEGVIITDDALLLRLSAKPVV